MKTGAIYVSTSNTISKINVPNSKFFHCFINFSPPPTPQFRSRARGKFLKQISKL